MPTIFREGPWRFFFYSNEGTEPPHVHVARDGRTVSVPTDWFPRLVHASEAERRAWTLIGDGSGIHWPAVDEDISVSALIAGERSNESPPSLRRWLDSRQD